MLQGMDLKSRYENLTHFRLHILRNKMNFKNIILHLLSELKLVRNGSVIKHK